LPFATNFRHDRLFALNGSGEFIHIHAAAAQKAGYSRRGVQQGKQVVFNGNHRATTAFNAFPGSY
jgi:hypothetical protein